MCPKTISSRHAQWHDHVNHVQAPRELRHWLVEPGSLTAKLIAHSGTFRVQRLYQRQDLCWADELTVTGLTQTRQVHAREVILRCDNVPTVYAHTVLPLNSTASQWPLFSTLGEKSLGSTLFRDPQVKRGALQFARLQPNHPAMQRAKFITRHEDDFEGKNSFNKPLFARRSLFYRRGGVMLVTELFLPTILLMKKRSI